MILMYEDEEYYIEEYIEKIKKEGFEIEIFDNAQKFIRKVKEAYEEIQLFIIDVMVFGPGNEFKGRNTSGGARSGLMLLDEIAKVEKEYPGISQKKIIFTNRKGPVFEEAQRDKRVENAIRKSDVLPSEFIEIVKEVI